MRYNWIYFAGSLWVRDVGQEQLSVLECGSILTDKFLLGGRPSQGVWPVL